MTGPNEETLLKTTQLSVKHLLGIKDLTVADVQLFLDTASYFKEVLNRPIKKVPSLRDLTIVNAFFENSTRTRLSFELAEKRLGADIINFSSTGSSVKKGETLLDTINNILAMKVDVVVMRHASPGAPHFLSRHINANIVNAGDGTHEHPTQALLDAFSIREKLGTLKDKRIAIIGDITHSRVALSNIFLLKKMGAEVLLCGPSTLIPRYIKEMGVEVTHNLDEALAWCEVANVLRIQLERQQLQYFPSLREYSLHFGINQKKLDALQKPIVLMHPGPINRGVELSTDAADGPHSIILNQVENGVAVRMAVLYLLANHGR
jgi:aspartate carbamoyltransferase catalytic subunit